MTAWLQAPYCLHDKVLQIYSASIDPSSSVYPYQGSCWEGWILAQLPYGERQGSPWTGCQSDVGLTHRQETIHCLIINWPNPTNSMSLDCGRKLGRTCTNMGRTCELHTENLWPEGGAKLRTFLWGNSANHHSTMWPKRWQQRIKTICTESAEYWQKNVQV